MKEQETGEMFLGNPINVARYDVQSFPVFEKLTEKQLSFFWRPEEIDVSKDRLDYNRLPDYQKHIFISNLKYQTLLDSIQGRSPLMAFLPLCSVPEMECWINTWAFQETVHSRSYTHIIRNIVNEPNLVFDDIVEIQEIVERAESTSKYYNKLIEYVDFYNVLGYGKHNVNGKIIDINEHELKKLLYLTIMNVNILEGISFYVSFACSFAFAENKLMEGNAKIIKLIARDEQLHVTSTQHILNIMKNQESFRHIAIECESEAYEMFKLAAEQEKSWAKYLFKDGTIIGLNYDILCQYIEFLTDQKAMAVGLNAIYNQKTNPLPWIKHWLSNEDVQVAPQETEKTDYLVGQINSEILDDDLNDMSNLL